MCVSKECTRIQSAPVHERHRWMNMVPNAALSRRCQTREAGWQVKLQTGREVSSVRVILSSPWSQNTTEVQERSMPYMACSSRRVRGWHDDSRMREAGAGCMARKSHPYTHTSHRARHVRQGKARNSPPFPADISASPSPPPPTRKEPWQRRHATHGWLAPCVYKRREGTKILFEARLPTAYKVIGY